MTNEAPAKAVISHLKTRGEKLDRIVMICTDKVKEPVKLGKDVSKEKPEYLENDRALLDWLGGVRTEIEENEKGEKTQTRYLSCSPASYFRFVIGDYASHNAGYEIPKEAFQEIRIGNVMGADEISRAVIEAADEITKYGEEIHLFIDFNGGMRDVAFMLLSISNLMKLRGIQIEQILTTNFDNKIPHPDSKKTEKVAEICVRNPVFESVDLISGINEYVRYGRIRGLKAYFAADRDPYNIRGNNAQGRRGEIRKLIEDMEAFSENLQLCRTDYILLNKEALYQKLKAYAIKVQSEEGENPVETAGDLGAREADRLQEQLFGYVVKDILQGYHGLLDGELPDIIAWCVEHDYIQQALTFCSEHLPRYLWEKGIFAPTSSEKKFYYDSRCVDVNGIEEKNTRAFFNKVNSDLHATMPESSEVYEARYSMYAYEWMVKFLYYNKNLKEGLAYLGMNENYGSGMDAALQTCRIRDLQNIMSESSYPGTMVLQNAESGDYRKLYFDTGPAGRNLADNKNVICVTWKEEGKENERGQINIAIRHAIKWIMLYEDGARIENRKEVTLQRVTDISIMYHLLKDQRNETNHASQSENGWSYHELCTALCHMVWLLKNIPA